jgi:hypothetical protein
MISIIKKILQKDKNAHIIIMEEGEPSFVVSSFEEYEKMLQGEDVFEQDNDFLAEIPSEEEIMGDMRQEMINLGEPEAESLQIIEEAIEDLPLQEQGKQEEKIDEIRIEDIPLL